MLIAAHKENASKVTNCAERVEKPKLNSNYSFVSVLSSAIPLVDVNHELLPIQFSIDPGDREDYGEKLELGQADCIGLLKEYLDVLTIDLHVSHPGYVKNQQ